MKYKGQGLAPDSVGTKWYNLKTIRTAYANDVDSPLYTVIENFDDELVSNKNYRLVLMTYKKKKKTGKGWRIPMLTPRWNPDTGAIIYSLTSSSIVWRNTWWPVTLPKTPWWSNSYTKISTCGLSIAAKNNSTEFKSSASKKMLLGVALFRKVEGQGRWGWQRCSNIAKIMLFRNNNEEIDTRVIE